MTGGKHIKGHPVLSPESSEGTTNTRKFRCHQWHGDNRQLSIRVLSMNDLMFSGHQLDETRSLTFVWMRKGAGLAGNPSANFNACFASKCCLPLSTYAQEFMPNAVQTSTTPIANILATEWPSTGGHGLDALPPTWKFASRLYFHLSRLER